jgi:hypothetical protein
VPENTDTPPPTRGRRTKKVSAVPRSVVMGMDKIERGVSLIAGAVAMALAAIISPHLFKDTWVTDTAKPSKTKPYCVEPFHLVKAVCQHTHLTHPSAWLPQFLEIVVFGLAIIFFALRRKRVGVAFCGLLLGLALGTIGLPFLFCGGWLIIRALRLQKYGDPTFTGSSRRAREVAQAKKEGRPVRSKESASAAASSRPAAPPTPSKRYTPKKRPRTR